METVKRRRKLFLEGPIVRALVTLAIPIVLGNVLQAGYQLTDAFWSGGWEPQRLPRFPSASRWDPGLPWPAQHSPHNIWAQAGRTWWTM